MSLTNEQIDAAFEEWWEKTGIFYDPDFAEVPWFDKRKGLAGKAYYDALCEAARPNERQAALEELARYMLHEFATTWSDLEDSHTVAPDMVEAIESRLEKLRATEPK